MIYTIWNAPAPTTAPLVSVTTGTAIKTMVQAKLGASFAGNGKVVEWGVIAENTAASLVKCSLLTTGTVAATVTAHVASGIVAFDPGGVTVTTDNPFTLSTITTGYTATAEGTIVASRVFDFTDLTPSTTNYDKYVKQWPLGREPQFKATEYPRIRVLATVAVNMLCYMCIEV